MMVVEASRIIAGYGEKIGALSFLGERVPKEF